MLYPNGKKFALTIVDDTDNADLENIRPIYEMLYKLGFRTTKTVWVFPPKDHFRGLSLENYRYRQYIKKLQKAGFEIALHGVGSGDFKRPEIIKGLKNFRQFFGNPKMQINHSQNKDNLYWGVKRFHLLRFFWRWSKFKGDDKKSAFYWGDLAQKQIKFVRNFTFSGLNTTEIDPLTPYHDPEKPNIGYFFSSADGGDVEKFNRLTAPQRIARLKKEGGAGIIYTHFASGFVRSGRLNHQFRQNLIALAKEGGWLVPASELLEYLIKTKPQNPPTKQALIKLEFKWLWDKFLVGLKKVL